MDAKRELGERGGREGTWQKRSPKVREMRGGGG